jgi:hypothetical protein
MSGESLIVDSSGAVAESVKSGPEKALGHCSKPRLVASARAPSRINILKQGLSEPADHQNPASLVR